MNKTLQNRRKLLNMAIIIWNISKTWLDNTICIVHFSCLLICFHFQFLKGLKAYLSMNYTVLKWQVMTIKSLEYTRTEVELLNWTKILLYYLFLSSCLVYKRSFVYKCFRTKRTIWSYKALEDYISCIWLASSSWFYFIFVIWNWC